MSQQSPFDVLGVLPTAEIEVIRAAYRALANKYHPDRARQDVPMDAQARADRMREINWAMEELEANLPGWRARAGAAGPAASPAMAFTRADAPPAGAGTNVPRREPHRGLPRTGLLMALTLPLLISAAAVWLVAANSESLGIEVPSIFGLQEQEGGPNQPDTPPPTSASPAATEAAPNQGPGETPEPVREGWTRDAVWNLDASLEQLTQACGVEPGIDCVVETMETLGAGEEAQRFVRRHELFLIDFAETGVVDIGAVAAPWFNMGRPHPVFLNGDFDLMHPGALVPLDWQSRDSYRVLPNDALFWSEYAFLESYNRDDRGQHFLLALPVRQCRACDTLGLLMVRYSFDPEGFLTGVSIEPLTAE